MIQRLMPYVLAFTLGVSGCGRANPIIDIYNIEGCKVIERRSNFSVSCNNGMTIYIVNKETREVTRRSGAISRGFSGLAPSRSATSTEQKRIEDLLEQIQ